MAEIDPKEPCPCGSGKIFADCHLPKVKRGPPPITEHARLKIISEPDPNSRSVFEKTTEGTTLFIGTASGLSIDCGKCGSPLAQGIARTQLVGVVIKCNHCGAYNEA
jgi:hypothetical protein